MAKLEKYNGSVQLMAGITQKGGGDFALIEANAIQTKDDGTRLDSELTEIHTQITDLASKVNSSFQSETDPTVPSHVKEITEDDISNWNEKSNFSGSYNDLTNKPTIPTVNNATLTIQKNGANVATFTANASKNVTANISVPTKTSDLTNDSDFATNSSVDAKIATKADKTELNDYATKYDVSNYYATKNYVDTAINNIPSSGGGSSSSTAIIDVEVLPTENINRNALYRVREKIALLNGSSNFFGTSVIVKKVETLPTVGEFTEDRVGLYYQTSDNEVYVYYNAWMTFAELCALTELSYGGQVSSKEEATEVDTIYITNGDYDIYSYTDKWNKLNETKNNVKVACLYGYDELLAWLRENCRTKNILKVAVGHWDISGFCVHELLQNPTFEYSCSDHNFELNSATFTLFDSGWKIDESGHRYKQVVERTFAKPLDYPAFTVTWATINLRYQSDGTAITIVEDTNPAYTPYEAEETCFVTYTDNDGLI